MNLLGEAWVTSQDIATLVSDWQGRDIHAPNAGQEEGGAEQHDGQQLHPPSPVKRVVEGVKGVSREGLTV